MKTPVILAFFLVFFGALTRAQSPVKLISLHEIEKRVAKGNDTLYVINFWATWCAPCVEELPAFEKVTSSSWERPLKVILVSLDFKSRMQSDVIPFVKKNQLQSEVFVINEPDQQEFIERTHPNWSGALPATLFISNKTNTRVFEEKQLTFSELSNIILNFK